jgi:cytochrome c oxidase subunit 2
MSFKALALASGSLALAALVVPLPFKSSARNHQLVQIEASQYAYSPAVVTVSQGQVVTFELTSSDVVHGLYVDGYELELSAEPGRTERVSFEADRPGTFRMRCSTTCGPWISRPGSSLSRSKA